MFPNVSASFIQTYTDSDGSITDIQVEYESYDSHHIGTYRPKLKEDNTIIIHQAKTYTREELISKVVEGMRDMNSHIIKTNTMKGQDAKAYAKAWIENELD